MKRLELFLVCVLILCLPNRAAAQQSKNLRMLGEVHDFVQQSYDVAMAGEYAFVASGMTSGLRVLDLSHPAAPLELGYATNSDFCPGVSQWMADRVAVSGSYAYVLYFDGCWSATHYRLYVYDVADPSLPVQKGYLSLPDNCTSQFLAGDCLYVTAFSEGGFSGVKIIAVSDPMRPRELGSFETSGLPHSVAVEGTVAYVADSDALVVCDISDPESPVELGRWTPGGGGALLHEVAVRGNHLFLLDAVFGLRVLDISDHARMREVSSVPHHQADVFYSRMDFAGDTLCYLQHGDGMNKEFVMLDVSNPASPRELCVHEMPGYWWFHGFDYDDGLACVAAGEHGLCVIDLSDPSSPEEIGRYDPHGLASGMAVASDYAFVSTRRDSPNVVVYDVSDPTSPRQVNAFAVGGRPAWLSVRGTLLMVPGVEMNLVPGVAVLDISDPVHPIRAGWLPCPPEKSGVPLSVECVGRYALVAMAYGGVQIYDISDLEHPVALDGWTRWDPVTNQGFGVRNVKVAWPYLFVPDEAFGLYVLDISDPSNIVEVASYPTPGAAWWIDLSPDGKYLYLSDFSQGIRVLDVSDPLKPVEICHYEGNLAEVTHLRIMGDSLYVTDGRGIGLHVLDVSNPAAPAEVAYHETPGAHAVDVVVVGGAVYCLDATHFQIFELVSSPSGVDEAERASVPSSYRIESVFPNPFNAEATVVFALADPGYVRLRVYSINGQVVKTLVEAPRGAGRHVQRFEGHDLASGVYVLRLVTNGGVHAYRVALVK